MYRLLLNPSGYFHCNFEYLMENGASVRIKLGGYEMWLKQCSIKKLPHCFFFLKTHIFFEVLSISKMTSSVVPAHVQWTIIHELINIFGEHELNVLYSLCLMNIIVNRFILAFPIEPSRRKPAETHHKQALICSGKIWQHQPRQSRTAACVINTAWSLEAKTNKGSSTTSDSPPLIRHLHMIT